MEQTVAIEYGWKWNGSTWAEGTGTVNTYMEAHRTNTTRIYRRDCANATSTIYTSNTAVGASYYMETRDCRPKDGAQMYTCIETWRKTGAWATSAII